MQQEPGEQGETKLFTCFITFEADEDTRDVFYVVVGSIIENFRGVRLAEFQDDSLFEGPPVTAVELLHSLVTREDRLTAEQREELRRFTEALSEWKGDEES